MDKDITTNFVFLEDTTFNVHEQFITKYENLIYLAFVKNGSVIFELDFHTENLKYDIDLLAKFISAVSTWSKEMSNKGLEKIDQGNFKVGFIESKSVSFFYLATEINTELELKLHTLLRLFENKYSFLFTEEFIHDRALFQEFKPIVYKILSEPTIKNHFIPKLLTELKEIILVYPACKEIINFIDNRKTVSEIISLAPLEPSEVLELLSSMKIENQIDFEVIVKETDIFVLTPLGFKSMFCKEEFRVHLYSLSINSESISRCLELINGSRTIQEIANITNVDLLEIQNIFAQLLKSEYIKPIEDIFKSLLVIEYLFNILYKQLQQMTDYNFAYNFMEQSLKGHDMILSNLVNCNSKGIEFSLVKDFITHNNEFTDSDIYESFMDPLLLIFDILSDLSDKVNEDLQTGIFDEVNAKYGTIF